MKLILAVLVIVAILGVAFIVDIYKRINAIKQRVEQGIKKSQSKPTKKGKRG